MHDLDHDNAATVFRHSGWAVLRNRVYCSLQRTGQRMNRYCAFEDCGRHAYVVQAIDDPRNVRLAGSTCHDRFCVPCANERSRTIAANVVDHLAGKRARFITLTIGGAAIPLRDAIAHLYQSFRRLQRSAFWKRLVTGGIAFLEITWNPDSNRWHPHLHVLTHGTYMPKHQLSEQWQTITGDSFIVDIRSCKDNGKVTHYVAKYCSKPLNPTFQNDDDRLDEAVVAIKGTRMVITFGGWRGVLVTDKPDEDGWVQLGSLQSFIDRAARGDVEARSLLHLLSGTRAETAIEVAIASLPPPPTLPPTQPKHDQSLLVFPPIALRT